MLWCDSGSTILPKIIQNEHDAMRLFLHEVTQPKGKEEGKENLRLNRSHSRSKEEAGRQSEFEIERRLLEGHFSCLLRGKWRHHSPES